MVFSATPARLWQIPRLPFWNKKSSTGSSGGFFVPAAGMDRENSVYNPPQRRFLPW
jgi:hypothetical protein